MVNKNDVIAILNRLEGTLIADLKSTLEWAKNYENIQNKKMELGALNFTIFLLSLVACETLGFYTKGAIYHKEKRKGLNCEKADTSQYIMDLLKDFFPRDSYFKQLNRVLVFLRNHLVNGFGSGSLTPDIDIELIIDENVNNQIKVGKRNGKELIKLNSISFADQTIKVFDNLKQKIISDNAEESFLKNIIDANKFYLQISKRVQNQLNAIYKVAQNKGQTF